MSIENIETIETIKTIKTGGPEYQKIYYQNKYQDYHKLRYQEKKESLKKDNLKKYWINQLQKLNIEYDDINNQLKDENLDDQIKIILLSKKVRLSKKIDKGNLNLI